MFVLSFSMNICLVNLLCMYLEVWFVIDVIYDRMTDWVMFKCMDSGFGFCMGLGLTILVEKLLRIMVLWI